VSSSLLTRIWKDIVGDDYDLSFNDFALFDHPVHELDNFAISSYPAGDFRYDDSDVSM
jgi:hypothetical protein